jgi:hypothetical protein
MRRRAVLSLCALSTLFAISCFAPLALAKGLSPEERARLAQGDLIRRPIDVDLPEGPYFGGIAYAVIDAPEAEVMSVLLDTSAYSAIFPLTLEAREVGRKGDNRLVFFRHGGRFGSASYTAIVRRQSPSVIRFWLDPAFPHEIEDCWGYFRVTALSDKRTLLTYAALLRLEFGVVRMLFLEKIRTYAMNTPLLVRRYFEGKGRGR